MKNMGNSGREGCGKPSRNPRDPRKSVTIEDLLSWAYRDELPKLAAPGPALGGFESAWLSLVRHGEIMPEKVSDGVNRYGVVPYSLDLGEPHPDAVALGDVVASLEGLELDCDGFEPLADMPGLGHEAGAATARAMAALTHRDGAGRSLLKRMPADLIRRHAVMRDCPPWEGDLPEARPVLGANGRPRWFRAQVITYESAFGLAERTIEVDGWDAKRKCPMAGAYTKQVWSPDPAEIAVCRAEYQIWRAALDVVAEEAAALMTRHAIVPSARAWAPWIEGGEPARRILPDLRVRPMGPPLAKPRGWKDKTLGPAGLPA